MGTLGGLFDFDFSRVGNGGLDLAARYYGFYKFEMRSLDVMVICFDKNL